MGDYSQARENMVESQLRVNQVIDDKVLEAFRTVPRELFVPESKQGIAYLDEDIEIGEGRYLMEPMIFAKILEEALVTPDDMVLSIAGGTGYPSAILSKLASFVVTLEEVESFTQKSKELMEKLECPNTLCVTGPLKEGYSKQAPYQIIIINGTVDEVPTKLLDQLDDGGRLYTIIEKDKKVGKAVVYQRDGDSYSHRVLFDAFTPKVKSFEKEKRFAF